MSNNQPIIAPSLLASDYSHLADEISACEEGKTDWLHCDIMDGHFVPNISFGPKFVSCVRETTRLFLDVHLMIEKPGRFLTDFAQAGADLITVHYEADPHLHGTIKNIKKIGLKAGVAINPATSLSVIDPILGDVDLVLIMSVNPGYGGQEFIEFSYDKIHTLHQKRLQHHYNFLIEVDGGLNTDTVGLCCANGADVLVAGSYIFRAESIPGQIQHLRKKAVQARQSFV